MRMFDVYVSGRWRERVRAPWDAKTGEVQAILAQQYGLDALCIRRPVKSNGYRDDQFWSRTLTVQKKFVELENARGMIKNGASTTAAIRANAIYLALRIGVAYNSAIKILTIGVKNQ